MGQRSPEKLKYFAVNENKNTIYLNMYGTLKKCIEGNL